MQQNQMDQASLLIAEAAGELIPAAGISGEERKALFSSAERLVWSPILKQDVKSLPPAADAVEAAGLKLDRSMKMMSDGVSEIQARRATATEMMAMGWLLGEKALKHLDKEMGEIEELVSESRKAYDDARRADYASRLERIWPLNAEARKPGVVEIGLTKYESHGSAWKTATLFGRSVWSNGFILDTSPPKGYPLSGVQVKASRRSVQKLMPRIYGNEMVALGMERGVGAADRVVLSCAGSTTVVVNEAYVSYFRFKYPGAKFRTDKWGRTDRVHVFHEGEWVGLVMALNVAHVDGARFASLVAEAEAVRASGLVKVPAEKKKRIYKSRAKKAA